MKDRGGSANVKSSEVSMKNKVDEYEQDKTEMNEVKDTRARCGCSSYQTCMLCIYINIGLVLLHYKIPQQSSNHPARNFS